MEQENKQVEQTSKQEFTGRVSPLTSVFAPRPDIGSIYINTFTAGSSISDVYIVLERNGYPIAVLNMPYGTAKSLQKSLANIIESFESTVGQPVVTMEEANEMIRKTGDNV